MIYSNDQLHDLQARFIQNNDWAYYTALKEIATYQIIAQLKRTGYGISNYMDTLDDKADDVVFRLLEMYHNDPQYRITGNIANRLHCDVMAVLYGKKTRRLEDESDIEELELDVNFATQPHEISQDPILALDNVDLYHLYTSKYYSLAIKALAQVKGKKYVYERAQELRYVYLMLVKGKEPKEKKKCQKRRTKKESARVLTRT